MGRIEGSDPLTNDLSELLKPFVGKDLRLLTNDASGVKIIPDEVCYAVVGYYSRNARFYDGKPAAEAKQGDTMRSVVLRPPLGQAPTPTKRGTTF